MSSTSITESNIKNTAAVAAAALYRLPVGAAPLRNVSQLRRDDMLVELPSQRPSSEPRQV